MRYGCAAQADEIAMGSKPDRIRQLALLGSLGAGFLGAGLALLFASHLQRFALETLLVGIAAHGWAMFAKSRLERQAGMHLPPWARAAEWICWLMLAGLILYVITVLAA
jgi:hypothetical protein